MAETKISELTQTSIVSDTDDILIVDNTSTKTTKRATIGSFQRKNQLRIVAMAATFGI